MSTIGVILLSLVLILLNALAGELLYDAMNATGRSCSTWASCWALKHLALRGP